jgi:membrane protease YdiL (CAAX protease family)
MSHMPIEHVPSQTKPMPLTPLPLWIAVLFFGLPSLMFRVFVYNGIPFLMGLGLSRFGAIMIGTIIPSSVLLIAAVVGYRLEGNVFSWKVFKKRFRLQSFPGKVWLWIVGGIVLSAAWALLLAFTAEWLARIPGLALPAYFSQTKETWANWWILQVGSLLQLLFGVIREELWWRGYILPRQELNYGKRAWAVNGVLWALFHVPVFPTAFFANLLLYLTVPFVTQRTKSTWSGMIIHFVLVLPQLAF